MKNQLQRHNSEHIKHYSLENDKIYKNVNLFSTSTLNKEVTKLQANLEEKNIFLNTYKISSKFNQKEKFEKSNKEFHNVSNHIPKEKLFISKNTLFPSYNADGSLKILSKNSQNNQDTFFITKNESQYKKNLSLRGVTKSNNKTESLNATGSPVVDFTRYLSGLNESRILPLKTESDIRKKQNDASKLKHLYRKIFRTTGYTSLNEIHYEKLKEKDQKLQDIHRKIIKAEDPKKYHCEKIKEIRSKLNFMKGVIDYAYPLVTVERLKYQNIYFNTYMDKYKQTEVLKNERAKNSNNNFIDINEYYDTDPLSQSNARNSAQFYISKDMKESNKKFQSFSYNNINKNISLIPKHRMTADSLRFLGEDFDL